MADQTNVEEGRVIVVDLGKKKRKQVRRLRKGKGRLMGTVQELLADMRLEGQSQDGDTIVVVVEQKARRWRPPRWV